MNIRRFAIRAAITGFQALRRSIWYFTQPTTFGVQAIPLTADGRVILVRHSYTQGWHLPGGGVKKNEQHIAAMIRELEEDIGMQAYGEIHHLLDFQHRSDFRRDSTSLFLIQDVQYSPRLSLEIEEIAEFDLTDLPADAAPAARRLALVPDKPWLA